MMIHCIHARDCYIVSNCSSVGRTDVIVNHRAIIDKEKYTCVMCMI